MINGVYRLMCTADLIHKKKQWGSCSLAGKLIAMKTNTLLFALLLMPAAVYCQLFTKVTAGPQVTTGGDSRSVNFTDVNDDGWDDIFITNGPSAGGVNFLFLNDGDGTFTKVAGDVLVTTAAPYDGAAIADADNDGDQDVLAVTWYDKMDYFFLNNGDATFSYAAGNALNIHNGYSETASWGDYDQDGWLDAYITNSEGDFKNFLYHNNGDGSFTRITTGIAVTDASTSRGVTWADYDNDGDPDLYVTNESGEANNLYRNDDGVFVKVTAGPLVNDNRSTMSASWGDVDNDGDLDVFTANSGYFSQQDNQLFINDGSGNFTEITTGDAVTDGGCSFGSSFADYDNDGDLDLAVSNGFCNGTIKNFLYLNDGHGVFNRDQGSITDLVTPCSYGLAWGDGNHDGFQDLMIATCRNSGTGTSPDDLYYQNNGNGNHWLKLSLQGTTSNRSAIGARVKVKAIINGNATWQMREITTQSGHCGQNSLVVHFGLGDATMADSVWVQFPAGYDTVLLNVAAGQQLDIVESSVTGLNDDIEPVTAISCFPNPSGDTFTIVPGNRFNQDEKKITLYDTTGKIWFERLLAPSAGSVVCSLKLPAGLYIVDVRNEREVQQVKHMVH